MPTFDLYYWPLPFRGQFIRAILAFAGHDWNEHDSSDVGDVMNAAPSDQPLPFMGPPLLIDNRSGFAIAEMPAIALYLGECLDLLPPSREGRAMTAKIVNDANDVLDEITLGGGREMWTQQKWAEFEPRLKRWMTIWEVTGKRHRLAPGRGFLLGTDRAGVADIVSATLWSVMTERFSAIASMLNDTAPLIADLTARMQSESTLAALSRQSFENYGEGYCGGEIEASLRKVVQ